MNRNNPNMFFCFFFLLIGTQLSLPMAAMLVGLFVITHPWILKGK